MDIPLDLFEKAHLAYQDNLRPDGHK
jgi:hypothetical protein